MMYPLLNKSTISYLMSSGKDFLAQEILPTDCRPIIHSGPKFYRKLEFQFRVLKFPLNFLRKTQISIRTFESLLAKHDGCYCPIFEPSIVITVRGFSRITWMLNCFSQSIWSFLVQDLQYAFTLTMQKIWLHKNELSLEIKL